MSEIPLLLGLSIALVALVAEYSDSSLGMGYGTLLTPILMLMGFTPLQVVPAVLVSELITGFLAGFTHHSMGNVDLKPKSMSVVVIYRKIRELGMVESFRRGVPRALKVVIIVAACSAIGTVAAVTIAVKLPKFYLTLYIGVLLLAIGILILLTMNRTFGFSWGKITALGLLASFNKGMSGGGYGPVVTGGQLLAGVDEKNAVGITSLAEGITCLVGVICYLMAGKEIDFFLAPWLVGGALVSVPLSGITIKHLKPGRLKPAIAIATLILGCTTLYKLFV